MTERLPELLDAKAFVYVFEADHGVKVGITIQTVRERMADLERGFGMHVELVRVYPVASRREAYEVEQIAHWLLGSTRTVGEWFHCHPFEATAAVERVLRNSGNVRLAYLRDRLPVVST